MIVAGFGFSARAQEGSLRDALHRVCAATGISAPQALATAQDKAAGVAPVARALGLNLHAVPHETLMRQVTQTRSARVMAERGTGSVAEAAALAAAGPGARLLTQRIHSKDQLASCALARGDTP